MANITKYRTSRISTLIVFSLLNFTGQGIASELPTVSELLLGTPFSSKHTQQVLAGEIAATDVIPVSESELAQGVACLVKNDTLKNLETIRSGTWLAPEQHILSSALIPDHASLSDFKDIRLNPQYKHEVQRFINAKAGNELNLSLPEISKFRKLKASESKQLQVISADQLIQDILLTRYQKYREQGLKGVTPYARIKDQETLPGKQLMTSLKESLALKKMYPKLYNLLKQYPQPVKFSVAEDYFWYMVDLDDRPAIGLSHRLYTHIDDTTFIVERGYYISHTIDTVQILISLSPVKEGTLLVYNNRTWTEKISGLFSSVKRKIAYKIMISEMEHVMKNLNVCRSSE